MKSFKATTVLAAAIIMLFFVPITAMGDPTDSLIVESSGNVGIGTTSPTWELEVYDASNVVEIGLHSDGNAAYFIADSAADTNAGIYFKEAGTAKWYISNQGASADELRIGDGSDNPLVTILQSGNVGIGTTNPSQKLDVGFDTDVSAVIGRVHIGWMGGNDNATFSHVDKVGSGSYALLQNGAGETILNGASGARTDIRVGGVPSMRLHSSGGLSFGHTYYNADPGQDKVIIQNSVGIGETNPNYPLQMGSGAHVTTGGVWTNASSRQYKENIKSLSVEDALNALDKLEPTRFNYKVDKQDETLGFIAEDVPDLVATKDRKGLSPMDIVAVLTKVVQAQQKELTELKQQIKDMQ